MPLGSALVVLSAGASRRMGQPKALLALPSGQTFLSRILSVAAAAGVTETLVVLGPPHGETIGAALPAGARSVWNATPERGMLSSVQAGLRAVSGDAGGALLWPVDVPFVQEETVRRVLAAGILAAPQERKSIIPTQDGRGGHPIWVPRELFQEVMTLPEDIGLRALQQRHPERALRLPVADPFVLRDIDTPTVLAAVMADRGGVP